MIPLSWAASVRMRRRKSTKLWYRENHLQLNIGKTKELIVDF